MDKKLKAKVKFYPFEDGGRRFLPIGNGYAPYIKTENPNLPLAIRISGLPLSGGQFNELYHVEVELVYHPKIDYRMLIDGSRFQLTEGTRCVGELIVEK